MRSMRAIPLAHRPLIPCFGRIIPNDNSCLRLGLLVRGFLREDLQLCGIVTLEGDTFLV